MNTNPATSEEFEIAGVIIPKGSRKHIEIKVGCLFDQTDMTIPVEVIRGCEDGPTLFVSAAIHGDEINGVGVIQRLLSSKILSPKNIKGTLIAIPIVNVFGFNHNSRYLPDRRDLNRCFPGSKDGSLGARVANIFMEEIVNKSTHGIDLHTGAIHRTNLPQIRACLDNPITKELAYSFGVPVVINSSIRDGSLRQAAMEKGIPMLLFEGGEALRYEEKVIQSALFGVISIMESIRMIPLRKQKKIKKLQEVFIAKSSHWVRAPISGILHVTKNCGMHVKEGDLLGELSDPFGKNRIKIHSSKNGIIIGMSMLPLVNNGDALFNIATFDDVESVKEQIGIYDDYLCELEN